MEEKPAMSSSNGNGTLARFFRVEKKEESSRCVTDESDTNCTRSVTHQRGAGWTSIVPFSGVGQVLGTKQREPPTKSKLISSTGKLTEQGSKTSGKRPENLVSGPTKIPSPRKRRRQDSPPGLTIVDAFQKGNQKKETSTTRSSAESDISGSYLKPIVLEDSPHRDKALMLRQVSCPVCAILVPESCINQHLDSCLRWKWQLCLLLIFSTSQGISFSGTRLTTNPITRLACHLKWEAPVNASTSTVRHILCYW